MAREVAIAKIVERTTQQLVALRQQFQHHRPQWLPAQVAQRLAQRGVDGNAGIGCDFRRCGIRGDQRVDTLHEPPQMMRMDGRNHARPGPQTRDRPGSVPR